MLPGFYDALRDYLVRQGVNAVEVTDVEQVTENDGYCETCWYEYIVVRIGYLDHEGEMFTHTYYGEMSDLIREL